MMQRKHIDDEISLDLAACTNECHFVAAAIGLAGALGGAYLSSKGAQDAASTAAGGQAAAARIAAEEARFRPPDLSTLFGTVKWKEDGKGRVSGVDVDPSNFQQNLFGDSRNIYNLYNKMLMNYMRPDVGAGARNIYNEWQGLVAPTREQEQARLFAALQAKGITGIEGYDPRTGSNINPQLNSLFSSWAGADKQMASDAMNEYINRIRGLSGDVAGARTNMIGTGLLPYDTSLKYAMEIGGRSANPVGAQLLGSGLSNAAQTTAAGQMAGLQYKTDFWNKFSPAIPNMVNQINPTSWGYSSGALPQYSSASSLFNPTGAYTGVGGSGYTASSMSPEQLAAFSSYSNW